MQVLYFLAPREGGQCRSTTSSKSTKRATVTTTATAATTAAEAAVTSDSARKPFQSKHGHL